MNPVAPFPDPHFQAQQDAEHLRLLSLFHFVLGGFTAFVGLFPIIHIIVGLGLATGSFPMQPASNVTITQPNAPFPNAPFPVPDAPFPGSPSFGAPGQLNPTQPPAFFGWFFVAMGTLFLVLAQTLAVLNFLAGRALARRHNKTLIQVVAALNCLNVPLGTVLGVFTFIVLGRPSVMPLFVPSTQPNSTP